MTNEQPDYEADLARMRQYATEFGGFVYESGDGHCMWSAEAMDAEELREHWAWTDQLIANYVEDYEQEPYYTLGEPQLNWSPYAT